MVPLNLNDNIYFRAKIKEGFFPDQIYVRSVQIQGSWFKMRITYSVAESTYTWKGIMKQRVGFNF